MFWCHKVATDNFYNRVGGNTVIAVLVQTPEPACCYFITFIIIRRNLYLLCLRRKISLHFPRRLQPGGTKNYKVKATLIGNQFQYRWCYYSITLCRCMCWCKDHFYCNSLESTLKLTSLPPASPKSVFTFFYDKSKVKYKYIWGFDLWSGKTSCLDTSNKALGKHFLEK